MAIKKKATFVILSLVILVSLTVSAMASGSDESDTRSHYNHEDSSYCTDENHEHSSRGSGSGCYIHGEAGVVYRWTGEVRVVGNELQQLWECTCVPCDRTWYEWF